MTSQLCTTCIDLTTRKDFHISISVILLNRNVRWRQFTAERDSWTFSLA